MFFVCKRSWRNEISSRRGMTTILKLSPLKHPLFGGKPSCNKNVPLGGQNIRSRSMILCRLIALCTTAHHDPHTFSEIGERCSAPKMLGEKERSSGIPACRNWDFTQKITTVLCMSILFKLFVQSWFGSHHCLERTSLPLLKKEICNFSQTKSWPISPTNRSPSFNQPIAAKGGEILEVGSEWLISYHSMEYTLTCITYMLILSNGKIRICTQTLDILSNGPCYPSMYYKVFSFFCQIKGDLPGTPRDMGPRCVGFPYNPHIFRDSYGSCMGIVWVSGPIIGGPWKSHWCHQQLTVV